MRSAELKRAKRRIRREVLAAREALPPEERTRMGSLATDRFLVLPEVGGARVVMAFWSFGSEVPTADLIARLSERGTTVVLPRIEGADLVPVRYAPGDPTAPTSFGAREPVQGEPVPTIDIDVMAVPGVAFDRSGRRIGYGGGYYDRLLLRTHALSAGLAFDLQVLDGPLPEGPADVLLDAIVTDRATIRPARA